VEDGTVRRPGSLRRQPKRCTCCDNRRDELSGKLWQFNTRPGA
jgi:hypothetical protein